MAMYISIKRSFIAEHLHYLAGLSEPRHGHNWKAEIVISINNLKEKYACIATFDQWINTVNYTSLNDHTYFKDRNPTTELVAQWLFQILKQNNHNIIKVKIQEKENYWAAYNKKQ